MGIRNLPVDVISNVSSYLIGEHKDIRMKHNKALKQLQNKYKPEVNTFYVDIGLWHTWLGDDPWIDLYEDIRFCIKPKVKTMDYAMNLIPQQTDKVRQCISQSHQLYLQPDMRRKIEIRIESHIELKSRYCHETNTPYIRRVGYDTDDDWEIEDDIDEALEFLKENLEYEIKDTGEFDEEVDGILIHDISFTINFRTDTDEFR